VPVSINSYTPTTLTKVFKKQPYAALTTLNHAEETILVYPLTPPEVASSFKTISIPGMRTIVLETPSMLETSNLLAHQLDSQVAAELRSTDYRSVPGQTLYFDASPSKAYHDKITTYEWDFDGDGTYDRTTTTPETSETYNNTFSGHVNLRISTNGGLQSTSKATITISSEEETILAPPKSLVVTKTSETTARLSWELPSENLGELWLVSINDFPSGYFSKDQTSSDITELNFAEDSTFSIRALSREYRGESLSVTLKAHQTKASVISTNSEPLDLLETQNTIPISNSDTKPHLLEKVASLRWVRSALVGGIVALVLISLVVAGVAFALRRHTA
jgi:PKD repeat protein